MRFKLSPREDTDRCTFRQRFYFLIKDLVNIIKADYPNCILLGDFNTAIGIMDSAYAENDVEATGYLTAFRSMSDWLETLLTSEAFFLFFRII